jgi:hypothetical protein
MMKGKYWEAFHYVISKALDPAIPLISIYETPLIYLCSSLDRNEIIKSSLLYVVWEILLWIFIVLLSVVCPALIQKEEHFWNRF